MREVVPLADKVELVGDNSVWVRVEQGTEQCGTTSRVTDKQQKFVYFRELPIPHYVHVGTCVVFVLLSILSQCLNFILQKNFGPLFPFKPKIISPLLVTNNQ